MKKTIISISVIIVFIVIGIFSFDAYTFFKLETFSHNDIETVCKTMSNFDNYSLEIGTIPNNEKHILYLLSDNNEDRQAVFIIEKIYYHNIKKFERYKIKYTNVDEQEVSSLSIPIDDTENLLIYYWNEKVSISKITYKLIDKSNNSAINKSIDNIDSNYSFIKYNTNNYQIDYITFFDTNDYILYSERRSTGFPVIN